MLESVEVSIVPPSSVDSMKTITRFRELREDPRTANPRFAENVKGRKAKARTPEAGSPVCPELESRNQGH